jgi:uncharacterized protein (DUF433 family)
MLQRLSEFRPDALMPSTTVTPRTLTAMEKKLDALHPPHISSDPDVMGGTPVFAGSRLPVETLLACVAAGTPWEQILNSWPWLTSEHLAEAERFAQTHDTSVLPWSMAGSRANPE